MTQTRRIELLIHGRVQGVGFRWATREEARRLGLRGWVRNRVDGTVQLVAEGPAAAIEALRRWCGDGPPLARVDRVEEFEVTAGASELEGPFDVRH